MIATSWAWNSQANDVAVGLDLHYLAPLSPDAADPGVGIAGRLGRRFKPGNLQITPELMAAYESFGGAGSAKLYRALAGIRFGYDAKILRPGVFAHGGLGRTSFDVAGPASGHWAFTYGAGAFLDFTLLPLFSAGAHAGFNQILKGDSPDTGISWLSAGVHAEFAFGFF